MSGMLDLVSFLTFLGFFFTSPPALGSFVLGLVDLFSTTSTDCLAGSY